MNKLAWEIKGVASIKEENGMFLNLVVGRLRKGEGKWGCHGNGIEKCSLGLRGGVWGRRLKMYTVL